MPSITAFTLLALSCSVLSTSISATDSNKCKDVTSIVNVLSQYRATAISFCSSFISIPVKTTTSTLARKSLIYHKSKSLIFADHDINAKTVHCDTSSHRYSDNASHTSLKSSCREKFYIIYSKINKPDKGCCSFVKATSTITPTVTFSDAPFLDTATVFGKRDIEERSPQSLPSYISTLLSPKISSACSCLSITPSTTTVITTSTISIPKSTITVTDFITKAPTTTTISIVTVTAATTITECAQPQPTFILKLGTSVIYNGTQLKDTYGIYDIVQNPLTDARTDRIAFPGLTAPSDEGVLTTNFLTHSFLVSENTGRLAVRDAGETGVKLFHFEDGEYAGESMDEPPVCSVAGGVLNCAYGNVTILQLCPGLEVFTNDLYFGPTVGSGCVEVVLEVVLVCVLPVAVA